MLKILHMPFPCLSPHLLICDILYALSCLCLCLSHLLKAFAFPFTHTPFTPSPHTLHWVNMSFCMLLCTLGWTFCSYFILHTWEADRRRIWGHHLACSPKTPPSLTACLPACPWPTYVCKWPSLKQEGWGSGSGSKLQAEKEEHSPDLGKMCVLCWKKWKKEGAVAFPFTCTPAVPAPSWHVSHHCVGRQTKFKWQWQWGILHCREG